MMELTKVFNYKGAEVRTVVIDDEIWFVGKDVARVLGYQNTTDALGRHIDEDDKLTSGITMAGQNRNVTIINESGLYELIFSSKLEGAKKFKKWVTKEVLPSIRMDGGYIARTVEYDEESIMAKALIIAQRKLEGNTQQLEDIKAKIEAQAPLVSFAKSCIASNESILVRELAKVAQDKDIIIGEKNLYKKLRAWDLILNGKTEPSQKAMNMGLFEVELRVINNPSTTVVRTTKVTPKGQIYIINKLLKEQEKNLPLCQ